MGLFVIAEIEEFNYQGADNKTAVAAKIIRLPLYRFSDSFRFLSEFIELAHSPFIYEFEGF